METSGASRSGALCAWRTERQRSLDEPSIEWPVPVSRNEAGAWRVRATMQTKVGTTRALWLAILLIIGHYLAQYGVGGALAVALGIHDRREIWQAPPAAFIISLAVGAVELGLVQRIGMVRYASLSFYDAGWRDITLGDVGYGLVGFALCAACILCTFAIDNGFHDSLTYIVDRVAHYTPQQRAFFTLMGVIAAIPEETIFRGILQPTLQAKLGRWQGLVMTAVIFAVYHFLFALPQLAGKLCFGLIFGLLRERTGTLWAPAFTHALTWIILGAI